MSKIKIKDSYTVKAYYVGTTLNVYNISDLQKLTPLKTEVLEKVNYKIPSNNVYEANNNITYALNGSYSNLPYTPNGKTLIQKQLFGYGSSNNIQGNYNINTSLPNGIDILNLLGYYELFDRERYYGDDTSSTMYYFNKIQEINNEAIYSLLEYHYFMFSFDDELVLILRIKRDTNNTIYDKTYLKYKDSVEAGWLPVSLSGSINISNANLSTIASISQGRCTIKLTLCETVSGNNIICLFKNIIDYLKYTPVENDIWNKSFRVRSDEVNYVCYFSQISGGSGFKIGITEYERKNYIADYKLYINKSNESDITLPSDYEDRPSYKIKYFNNLINSQTTGNFQYFEDNKYVGTSASKTNINIYNEGASSATQIVGVGINAPININEVAQASTGTWSWYNIWFTDKILLKLKLQNNGDRILYNSAKLYVNGELKESFSGSDYASIDSSSQSISKIRNGNGWTISINEDVENKIITFIVTGVANDGDYDGNTFYANYVTNHVYAFTTELDGSYQFVKDNLDYQESGDLNIPENEPDIVIGSYDNKTDKIEIPDKPNYSVYSEGYINTYLLHSTLHPNNNLLHDLMKKLWSIDISDTYRKNVSDIFGAILYIKYCPFDIPIDYLNYEEYVIAGYNVLKEGTSEPYFTYALTKQYVDLDFGTIGIDNYFGNFLDFNPYTKFSLYLPFYGIIELNADLITKSVIGLKYRVNLLTGETTIYVTGSRQKFMPYDNILYTCNCNVYENMQIIGRSSNSDQIAINQMGILANAATSMLTNPFNAISTGVGAIVSSATNALSLKQSYKPSGQVTGNAFCCYPKAYLIIERPVEAYPKDYQNLKGFTSNIRAKLKNLKGFTQISDIKIESKKATTSEEDEIKALLSDGVYL